MSNEKNLERETIHEVLKALKPFFAVSKTRFYIDLILTGTVAWGSLFLLSLDLHPLTKLALFVISYSAFFRGHAFIHEVIHFYKKIKHLDLIYNLVFGYTNRMPFYIYIPHQLHHLPTTFATPDDPEYLYMKGKGIISFILPFITGPLLPFFMVIRFGILPLLMPFISDKKYEWLLVHTSTIVVNPKFKRKINPDEIKDFKKEDLKCALVFVGFIVLFATGVIPLSVLGYWYALMTIGTTVNIWRARIAHRYDNEFDRLSTYAQIRDSVTIENDSLCFLWAPLGLNYHSLHHLAPQIPYYNLKVAHQTLCTALKDFTPYQETILPGFSDGIRQFAKTVQKPG